MKIIAKFLACLTAAALIVMLAVALLRPTLWMTLVGDRGNLSSGSKFDVAIGSSREAAIATFKAGGLRLLHSYCIDNGQRTLADELPSSCAGSSSELVFQDDNFAHSIVFVRINEQRVEQIRWGYGLDLP